MESPSMLTPSLSIVRRKSLLPLVHRHYILLKAHYFLYFSAFGILYPIINLTLRNRGLSNNELSYINIIVPFLAFFTNPLAGFIADKTRRYLFTFNMVAFIVTIIFSFLFVLPIVKTDRIEADMIRYNRTRFQLDFCANPEVGILCASRSQCGCTYQANCTYLDVVKSEYYNQPKSVLFNISMNSSNVINHIENSNGEGQMKECGIDYQVSIKSPILINNQTRNLNRYLTKNNLTTVASCNIICSTALFCRGSRLSKQFGYILIYSVLFIIGTNFLQNAIALGISIGFATIDRPEIFGQQRIYGTIGFGLAALIASRVYEWLQTEYVYIIMFSVTMMACIIVTGFIRIEIENSYQDSSMDENTIEDEIANSSSKDIDKTPKEKEKDSQFSFSQFAILFKRTDVIIFLLLAFAWGMSYGGMDPYLYLYIDEIVPCHSRSIVGIMATVSAISEVVALYVGARVLKLLGIDIASIIIFLAFSVRFAGYYFITDAYYLIIMETMHFFNFGILYVLMAQKADSIAPNGLAGTFQGVAFGVSFGLGRSAGLLVASFIYIHIKQRNLFLIFSLFNLIAAIAYTLSYIISKQGSNNSNENTNYNRSKIAIEFDTSLKQGPLLSSTEQIDEKQNRE